MTILCRLLAAAVVAGAAARQLSGGGAFPVLAESFFATYSLSVVLDSVDPAEINSNSEAQLAIADTIVALLAADGIIIEAIDVTNIVATSGGARRRLLATENNVVISYDVQNEVADAAKAEVELVSIVANIKKGAGNGGLLIKLKEKATVRNVETVFSSAVVDVGRSNTRLEDNSSFRRVKAPSPAPTPVPTSLPTYGTPMPTVTPPTAVPTAAPSYITLMPSYDTPMPTPPMPAPTPAPLPTFDSPTPTFATASPSYFTPLPTAPGDD
ncbi:hypothetical protein M885DRAFT_572245 [Pelagophyceae sp. CCMP2097]|nr:hypothetical protein M885DRAFT_572245 [Pelagophyceae sp. CCMP2097]